MGELFAGLMEHDGIGECAVETPLRQVEREQVLLRTSSRLCARAIAAKPLNRAIAHAIDAWLYGNA